MEGLELGFFQAQRSALITTPCDHLIQEYFCLGSMNFDAEYLETALIADNGFGA